MIFANPVGGTIHPLTWKRPAGNHEPHLVRGFGPTHDGIDVSFQRVGDPILAAAAGKVYAIERDAQGSLFVCIDHGSRRTLYGHLNDETTKVGAQVAAGALIGHCGYSGHTIPEGPGGAHLHFEVFDAATKRYDPWPLLRQNVTVHPITTAFGVNVRNAATTDGRPFATTKPDGLIHRLSDDASLGPISAPRKWGGSLSGGSYSVDGVTGNRWERMDLDGAMRLLAAPLAVVSAK